MKASSTHFFRFVFTAAVGLSTTARAQHGFNLPIQFITDDAQRKVSVNVDGKPFTTFIYPDTLEKPVLYPIYAPDGQVITRGFPLQPRTGEPVDHPHHIGLWFDYENVNGLDFWNNSFAIPAAKKSQYGWIRKDGDLKTVQSGKPNGERSGILTYHANWTDQAKNVLLQETTRLEFRANAGERVIDRITTLKALQDVKFADAKDGLLGLRVTKELQIPSNAPGEFVDDKGIVTKVAAGNTPDINGTYLTSEGKRGDSAWGTRGTWCMMYGRKLEDTLSVVMIDHPSNPGFPTYWHARGYGLFAANPLGQKVFSNGKQVLNFKLSKGESVTFRYRIIVAAGKNSLSTDRITQLADNFAHLK